MKPPGNHGDDPRQKQRLADALSAMTSGDAAMTSGDAGATNGRSRDESPLAAGDAEAAAEVWAPRPDPSAFARPRPGSVSPAEAAIHRKRTLIPILLTLGVILPTVASLKWLSSADSPFTAFPAWISITLTLVGLCLLVLAILNMLHVREATSHRPAR